MSSHSIEELLHSVNPKFTDGSDSNNHAESAEEFPDRGETESSKVYTDPALQKYLKRLVQAQLVGFFVMMISIEVILTTCFFSAFKVLLDRIGFRPSFFLSLAFMIAVAVLIFRNRLHIPLYLGITKLLRPRRAPQCPECEAAWLPETTYQCSSCEQSQSSCVDQHWSGSCNQCGTSPDAVVCWRCGSATRLRTGSRLGAVSLLHRTDAMQR